MENGIELTAYRDKVYGCWQGKSIGGTLGMPYEGVPDALSLDFYEHVPSKPVPNDDLELQLIWLWYAEKYGARLSARHLAEAWDKHIGGGPDEYGVAVWNIRRRIMPPRSGSHNNFFTCGMGAAIRSEIWACVFPGRPQFAAHYAREDACVDHDGDGVWAEVFLAAAESAAFVADGPVEALREGLRHVPAESRVTRAVRFVMELHDDGVPLGDVRGRIMADFGSHNFTDCVMNLAFITAGVLYGEGDFGRTILTAVNFGMDADCTGATTGAFMGILHGSAAIPEKWKAPLGDSIVVSEIFRDLPLPATLDELTDRTLALAERFAGETRDSPLPAATFGGSGKEGISDRYHWCVFAYPPDSDLCVVPDEVLECEREPEKYADRRVEFPSIHMELDPFVEPPGACLFLTTRFRVEADLDAFLMACADTGLTVWIDGKRVLDYFGRLKRLPAFHRTEGGAVIPVRLEAGREYAVRVRLLACHRPAGLTLAVGDASFNYVTAAFCI